MHLRITSLVVLNKRLWIGTGTGVIISVPLSEENSSKIDVVTNSSLYTANATAKNQGGPGGLLRVYGSSNNSMGLADSIVSEKSNVDKGIIPYCNITQAQLSFHGHKDAVRFFLPALSGLF